MRRAAVGTALLAALLVHAGAWAQGFHPGDAVRVNGVAEVDAEVAKLRPVYDTPEVFARRLETEGFTEESYRKHVRGMLAAGKYLDGMRAAVPAVSDGELAAYYRDNERRLTFPEEVRVRHILLTWKPLGTPDDRAAIRERM